VNRKSIPIPEPIAQLQRQSASAIAVGTAAFLSEPARATRELTGTSKTRNGDARPSAPLFWGLVRRIPQELGSGDGRIVANSLPTWAFVRGRRVFGVEQRGETVRTRMSGSPACIRTAVHGSGDETTWNRFWAPGIESRILI
jgi:hypothetical protein